MSQAMTRVMPADLVRQRMAKMVDSMPNKPAIRKRFQQAAIAICMNPSIQKCTPESVARAIYVCARLNLIPDPVLQEAHVIPFGGEAVFVAGYKGLVKLARNSDPGLEVRVGRVYSNDDYIYEDGMDQVFKITKRWWEKPGVKDRGDFVFAYAISRQGKADAPTLVVLSKQDGLDLAKKSKAGYKPGRPWHDFFEEMCEKTCVKRSARLWTLDPDKEETQRFRRAVALDEAAEGEPLPAPDAQDLMDDFDPDAVDGATATDGEKNPPPAGNVNMGNMDRAAERAAAKPAGRPTPANPNARSGLQQLATAIEEKLMGVNVDPDKDTVLRVLGVIVGGVSEPSEAEEIAKAAKPAEVLGFIQTLEGLTPEQLVGIVHAK